MVGVRLFVTEVGASFILASTHHLWRLTESSTGAERHRKRRGSGARAFILHGTERRLIHSHTHTHMPLHLLVFLKLCALQMISAWRVRTVFQLTGTRCTSKGMRAPRMAVAAAQAATPVAVTAAWWPV